MEIHLDEKLKALRKAKNISQEKLAQYLNISFQAVSKWETGGTYPDISLLPEIARFFGITVDELLQAEQIDEKRLYREYEEKAAEMWRNGQSNLESTKMKLLNWVQSFTTVISALITKGRPLKKSPAPMRKTTTWKWRSAGPLKHIR